jgi:amino acid adenylation domain-containing protein
MGEAGSAGGAKVRISRHELERLLDRAGGRSAVEDIYPATAVQRGMIYHSQLDPTAAVYVSSMAWRLVGPIDVEALVRAWHWLVARHSLFRTSFMGDELARPMQVVLKDATLDIPIHDLSSVDEAERERRFAALQAESRARPFEVSRAPLMRVNIVVIGPDEHRVIWTVHHALLDGWSMPLVLEELTAAYRDFASGRAPDLAPPLPFRDYVRWLGQQDEAAAADFWAKQLLDYEPAGPLGERGDGRADDPGAARHGSLDVAIGVRPDAIDELARRCRVTTSTIAAGAWALLLGRHLQTDDICFGLVVSGRPAELVDVDRRVGLFINTLPLRLRLHAGSSVAEFLREVQGSQLELSAFQYSALVEVKRWGGQPADAALFDSILVLDNYPRDMFGADEGAVLRLEKLNSQERTNYPLTVAVQSRHGLSLNLTYDRRVHSDEAARRYGDTFAELLRAMVADAGQRIDRLPWLTPERRAALIAAGRGPDEAEVAEATLPDRIWARAAATPDAPAVRHGAETISYGELTGRAEALARRLRARGVGIGDRVALLVRASPDHVVAALAVLRAGAAFVPLDADGPPERLAAMLADCRPVIAIADERADQAGLGVPLLSAATAHDAGTEPLPPLAADGLAYVMYTSGSTGLPKGVMIGHAALANFTRAMELTLGLRSGERVAWLTTPGFDISLLETLVPLACGGTVVIFPGGATGDAAELAGHVAGGQIDIVQATPAGWRLLLDAGLDPARLIALCGGEAVPATLAAELARRAAQCWHVYGPTETTIWSSAQRLTSAAPRLSIGCPIRNTELHVLDERLEPVDIGVAGKLYIGGAGLALGYLHSPSLTAAAFVPHPFRTGERLYATGDRARRTGDGAIEYLGRLDGQLKIRGQRIEAGEIEAALIRAGADQAKVLAAPAADGGLALRAWVTPADLDIDALDVRIRQALPKQAVPQSIVPVPAMPLNANGKIDVRALPAPVEPARRAAATPPSSATERALAEIWAEVLQRDGLGADDNLFAAGGHSLHASRIAARASDMLKKPLPLRAVLEHPTIARLAAYCDAAAAPGDGSGTSAPSQDTPAERQTLPDVRPQASTMVEEARQEMWESIAAALERQAEESPRRAAVVCGDEKLSYRELAERSNRLAHLLRERGAGPEQIVALSIERSIDMVVGLLAIVKSGAAFLPVDPRYPEERRTYLVEDSGAAILLTAESFTDPRLADMPSTAPEVPAHPDQIFYVIYTSGSTGRPKGVMVPQGAAAHVYRWYADKYELTEGRRVLIVTSHSFDQTLKDLFAPLMAGGTVVLAPPGLVDGTAMRDLIERHRVEVVNCTPSQFNLMLEQRSPLPLGLELAIVGGEPLRNDLLRPIGPNNAACRFVNSYGPTECTDTAIDGWVERPGEPGGVPLGTPIPQMRAELFDERLQPVGPGEAGELHLAGIGVARGYLGRPALTAERFIPDPAGTGGRLYRTGDLVRQLADGRLEFVGRVDSQIKIRGFRVELGEIEAALRRHPEVTDALVVSDGSRLGAHYIAARSIPAAELRAHLERILPDFMVPVAYQRQERFPLTPSGKTDRGALGMPAVDRTGAASRPMTPIERVVAEAYGAQLGLDAVGPEDSFFALGGHSLLAMRVVAQLRDRLDVDIPLHWIFDAPTVQELAAKLGDAHPGEQTAAERPEPATAYPLSFAQERMWFLEQFGRLGSAYNVPAVVRIRGALDAAALAAALDGLIARHEVLRTRFESRNGDAVQVIDPPWPLALKPEPTDEGALHEQIAETLKARIDLETGRLLRARLLRIGAEDHVLILVIHHIVTDAWTSDILIGDLAALYDAIAAGREPSLPPLPTRYVDWARSQRAWLTEDRLNEQLDWWREHLRGAPAQLALPLDRPRPATASHRGAVLPLRLDEPLAASLKELGRAAGATSFMTFLALYKVALARWTGQADLVVGTPIANRASREAEGIAGLFLNTLAVRTDLSRAATFTDAVRDVRESALGCYAHQELPFEKLVEHMRPERDGSVHPIFQTMFVLQHQAPMPAATPGALQLEPVTLRSGTAKFDFSLMLTDTADGIRGAVEYSTDLFDAETARRFAEDFRALAEAIVQSPGQPWRTLQLPGAASERASVRPLRDVTPARSATPHLVRLAHGETGDALFCIPPAGGTAMAYLPLAGHLHPAPQLFGFNAQGGMQGELMPDASIAAIAEEYLAQMRTARPEGPYHLLGYSVGGVIAFEMACRLRRAGTGEVSLVLVDPYIHDGDPLLGGELDQAAWAVCASVYLRHDEQEPRAQEAIARGLTGAEAVRAMRDALHRAGATATNLADVERMFAATRTLIHAGQAWRPDFYPGTVHLVLATRNRLKPLETSRDQWQRQAAQIVPYPVDVDHVALMDPPFLDQIGRIVTEAMAGAGETDATEHRPRAVAGLARP